MAGFLPALDQHFLKDCDHVVLDVRYMRPEQRETVLQYIEDNWETEEHRLILLR